MNKSLLLVIVLMSTIGWSQNSSAETVTCDQIIKACDKALADQKKLIDVSEQALQKSQEETKVLKDLVEAKDSELHSIVRSPTLLVGAGVLLSALAGPLAGVMGVVVTSVILK